MSRVSPSTLVPPSDWIFGPPRTPIVVRNAEALLAHLPLFLGGWPFRWAGAAAGAAPDIEVSGDDARGFMIAGRGPQPHWFADVLDAANGLASELINAYIMADPRLICLHAAAAEIDGRLVLLVGDSSSDKIDVALQLAVSGFRFFAGDRIAIRIAESGDAAAGLCLGLAPKARLPVPREAGERFANFIEAMSVVQTETMAYLKLSAYEAAEFAESRPLGAVVALERRAGAPAALTPLPRTEIAQAIVDCCLAPHLSAEARRAVAAGLAHDTPGFLLTFDSSAAAAGLVGLPALPR